MSLLEAIRHNILFDDIFNAVYYQALDFELMKYISHLKQCMRFFIESFDEKLLKERLQT